MFSSTLPLLLKELADCKYYIVKYLNCKYCPAAVNLTIKSHPNHGLKFLTRMLYKRAKNWFYNLNLLKEDFCKNNSNI